MGQWFSGRDGSDTSDRQQQQKEVAVSELIQSLKILIKNPNGISIHDIEERIVTNKPFEDVTVILEAGTMENVRFSVTSNSISDLAFEKKICQHLSRMSHFHMWLHLTVEEDELLDNKESLPRVVSLRFEGKEIHPCFIFMIGGSTDRESLDFDQHIEFDQEEKCCMPMAVDQQRDESLKRMASLTAEIQQANIRENLYRK